MAQKSTIISAIDIGTTKIVAIIGRKIDSGKFEILGFGKTESQGIIRGEVINIEETVSCIQQAVKEAETAAGIKMTDVYVGIAGRHIRSQRTSGYIQLGADDDEITLAHTQDLESQIYNTSVEMGEEIVHVLPQGYIVDNIQGVVNPVGVAGKRLEGNFHVVIGKATSANHIKKCVNRVGLNVKKLILEPLASARAVLCADELEAGVVMLDIGGGTTDVAIYCDNQIVHTGVIPFGGNSITSDIKKAFKIVSRYAEQLKKQYGRAIPSAENKNKMVKIPGINGRDYFEISFNELSIVIKERMEEIIEEAIRFVDASGKRAELGAVVLTGGGSLLKNLPQFMSFKTGLTTRIGRPRVAILGEAAGTISDPILSTAIGLMMEGALDMEGCQEFGNNQELFSVHSKKENDKADHEAEPNDLDEKADQATSNKKLTSKVSNKMNDLFSKFFEMGDTNM